MKPYDPFDLKFSSREVTAWGGLALLKRMLDGMDFRSGVQSWQLPPPRSNRGYRPEQLIEQMIVSIWCGAARFAQADITRLDATLVRLFDWGKAAGHKAIVRLFQRFDQGDSSRVQSSSFRWLFDKLHLNAITLDVDSTVLTRWGTQIEGGAKGYNPKHHGRASHHPLLAFVADWRLIANFWLRPGNTSASNNALSFLQVTLNNLGATKVGLFRADRENRIKELKADFGLGSFVLRDFWATEAALGVTMLAYNLMSVFRHAVMRQSVYHTLSTLHHKVLAVGAFWDSNPGKSEKQTFRLAVARKRRPWFEGLWANAGEPVSLVTNLKKS